MVSWTFLLITGILVITNQFFSLGENSDYIKHQHGGQIFSIFPKALFITVAGTGHWLHAENPGFVVSEIRKFIH